MAKGDAARLRRAKEKGRRGRKLETALRAQHREYRKARLAVVFALHPEAKYLRTGIQYTAKGPPDFGGMILGGRGVIFDAKMTNRTRWPYENLEHHQAVDLESACLTGACAFVCIMYESRKVYAVPWHLIREEWWRWHENGGAPASIFMEKDERAIALNGVDWLEVHDRLYCEDVPRDDGAPDGGPRSFRDDDGDDEPDEVPEARGGREAPVRVEPSLVVPKTPSGRVG